MAQIIVDPAEQRAFANALGDLVREMRGRERALAARFSTLQKSWQDDQAKKFARSQFEMDLYLTAFYNRCGEYICYLNDKARAAEKYLDCRG